MAQQSNVIHVRLTKEEYEALKEVCLNLGETQSRIIRKLLREFVNEEIDLLTDEQLLLKDAIRKLSGISNNLNQYMASVHAGNIKKTIDERYMDDIKKTIVNVKNLFIEHIKKSQKRWVKTHAKL